NEQHTSSAAHPVAYGKRSGALRLNVLKRYGSRSGHGADRAEHAGILRLEKWLRWGACHERPKLRARGNGQQSPELTLIMASNLVAASRYGGEERARIAAPLAAGRIFAGRYQSTRQLFDIPGSVNFRERIPFHGQWIEGIENDIASSSIVELSS